MATYSETARETGDFLIEQAYRELEAYNISVQLFMEIIDIANSHEDTELIEIANDNVEYSRRVLLNAIFEAIDYNQYVQYSRDLRAIISLLARYHESARYKYLDLMMTGLHGHACCQLCWEPVSLGTVVMERLCGHWFHPDCHEYVFETVGRCHMCDSLDDD